MKVFSYRGNTALIPLVASWLLGSFRNYLLEAIEYVSPVRV